jgi:hypothetical protein
MKLYKQYLGRKALNKIKDGDHDALMSAIEFLIDHKEENSYELGYQACLDDVQVYSSRLAERFSKEAKERNVKSDKKGYYLLDEDEVRDITEIFFNELIEKFKTEKP